MPVRVNQRFWNDDEHGAMVASVNRELADTATMAYANFLKAAFVAIVVGSCSGPPSEGQHVANDYAPKTVEVPAGQFVAGSDYAITVACTDGTPPEGADLQGEDAEAYCKKVGPQVWFADELPLRDVALTAGFEMAATEVTVGQFAQFVDETGYVTVAEREGRTLGFDGETGAIDVFSVVEGYSWRKPWPGADQAKIAELVVYPVVHVAIEDAEAYSAWLSEKTGETWRLPSADEWEYAALGGLAGYPSSGTYSWGHENPDGEAVANVSDISFSDRFKNWRYPILSEHDDGFALAAPVGSFAANGYGLHDMTGNVWEWTSTKTEVSSSESEERDFAVMKGGSFDFEMPFQRIQKNRNLSFVISEHQVSTSISVGFRVIRERSSDH